MFALIGLAVLGTVMQAQAQAQAAKNQAKWQKYQAAVAQAQAKQQEKMRAYEASKKREEGRRLKARQMVMFGKSGVLPQVGTPLLTMAEDAAKVERDARLITAVGQQEGRMKRSEAAAYRSMAKSTRSAGRWAAGTTLLTGFSGIGMNVYANKPEGTSWGKYLFSLG